jgi:hypothetical protein
MKKMSPLLVGLFFAVAAHAQQSTFQGQKPAQQVDTRSKPIEKQSTGVFPFKTDGVYFSNQFDGARLNRVERTGTDQYLITITPENSPINMSPWYAFQVWGDSDKEIAVTLAYPGRVRHRYAPQISTDGEHWRLLEAQRISEHDKAVDEAGVQALPKRITMRLRVGSTPQWVSAQELHTSKRVFGWMQQLARAPGTELSDIGQSMEGRPLRMLTMGNKDPKKLILVIARQHPPEVTGYFAMQAFVETIAGSSELAQQFRQQWGIHVIPLMNPDGVDGGHWRHNAGGIDLNRDWADANQPETLVVQQFLKKREQQTGGKFIFGIDFHSTWDDIYYPMHKRFTGNMPNLVWNWLENIQKAIPNYAPNIVAADKLEPTIMSKNYFLKAHGMESITFEIGDNTSRELILQKGRVGAEELMKLLMASPGK